MFCIKCNGEIADGAQFCPLCGAAQAQTPAPVEPTPEAAPPVVPQEQVSPVAPIEAVVPQEVAPPVPAVEPAPPVEVAPPAAVVPPMAPPVAPPAYIPPSPSLAETNGALASPKKSALPFVIIGLLVVLLGVGAYAAVAWDSIYFTIAPKQYLNSAINATVKKIEKEIDASNEALGYDKLEADGDYTQELNLTVDSVTLNRETSNLNIGLDVNAYYTKSTAQTFIEMALLYKKDKMIDFSAFADGKEMGFNVPELFDMYLTGPIEGNLTQELDKETIEALEKAYEKFTKSYKFGKAKNVKIDVDGKEKTAKAFDVKVPAEAANQLLKDVMDALLNDSSFASIPKEDLDIPEEIFEEDITVTFTKYGKYIVAIDAAIPLPAMDSTGVLSLELGTGANLIDTIAFSVKQRDSKNKDTVLLTVISNGKHVPTDKEYTDKTVVNVMGMDLLTAEEKIAIGSDSNEITGSLTSDIPMADISLDIKYSGTYDRNDKRTNIPNLTIDFSMPDPSSYYSFNSYTFNFKGGLSFKQTNGNSGKTIANLQRKKYEDLSDSEMEAINMKAMTLLEKFAPMIEELSQEPIGSEIMLLFMGGPSYDDYDYDYDYYDEYGDEYDYYDEYDYEYDEGFPIIMPEF